MLLHAKGRRRREKKKANNSLLLLLAIINDDCGGVVITHRYIVYLGDYNMICTITITSSYHVNISNW